MTVDSVVASEAATDISISMERANLLALLLLPVIVLVTLAPFWGVWGWSALSAGMDAVFRPVFLVPAFLLAVVVHEGLHGLGFLLFARAPRGALHFGIHRATLSPFAGCRVPVRADAYRLAVLLPALVLGVVPLLVGYALGLGAPAVWGALMLVAAGGDFLVLWVTRAVPAHHRVLDHPERVGCRVLPAEGAAHG